MKFFGNSALRSFSVIFLLLACFLGASPLAAQDRPLWLRYPSISP